MKPLAFICLLWITNAAFPKHGSAQSAALSFEQIDSLQQIERRNMVVFIHTDWCKYCQIMKHHTFENKEVVKTLKTDFYFASLNAESTETLYFNGHTFNFNPTGNNTGIHELAEALGTVKGKVSYPTLCILNSEYEIIFQHNSSLSTENLLDILQKVSQE